MLDIDFGKADAAAKPHGALALACDVTEAKAIEGAVARVVETYGGLDIVVSNAGAAWQGRSARSMTRCCAKASI